MPVSGAMHAMITALFRGFSGESGVTRQEFIEQ
jgi:hypothetical protein